MGSYAKTATVISKHGAELGSAIAGINEQFNCAALDPDSEFSEEKNHAVNMYYSSVYDDLCRISNSIQSFYTYTSQCVNEVDNRGVILPYDLNTAAIVSAFNEVSTYLLCITNQILTYVQPFHQAVISGTLVHPGESKRIWINIMNSDFVQWVRSDKITEMYKTIGSLYQSSDPQCIEKFIAGVKNKIGSGIIPSLRIVGTNIDLLHFIDCVYNNSDRKYPISELNELVRSNYLFMHDVSQFLAKVIFNPIDSEALVQNLHEFITKYNVQIQQSNEDPRQKENCRQFVHVFSLFSINIKKNFTRYFIDYIVKGFRLDAVLDDIVTDMNKSQAGSIVQNSKCIIGHGLKTMLSHMQRNVPPGMSARDQGVIRSVESIVTTFTQDNSVYMVQNYV